MDNILQQDELEITPYDTPIGSPRVITSQGFTPPGTPEPTDRKINFPEAIKYGAWDVKHNIYGWDEVRHDLQQQHPEWDEQTLLKKTDEIFERRPLNRRKGRVSGIPPSGNYPKQKMGRVAPADTPINPNVVISHGLTPPNTPEPIHRPLTFNEAIKYKSYNVKQNMYAPYQIRNKLKKQHPEWSDDILNKEADKLFIRRPMNSRKVSGYPPDGNYPKKRPVYHPEPWPALTGKPRPLPHPPRVRLPDKRYSTSQAEWAVISGKEQAPSQLTVRPLSYHAGDKKYYDDPVTFQHPPLQAEGDVLSREQQATPQLDGDTAGDIKTSQRIGPRYHSFPQGTALSGDQSSGGPYSYHTGNTPADYPKDRKLGKTLICLGVFALIITVILISYFCGYKKVCGTSNVIISTVATVPPKPGATNLSSTVIFTKNDATEPPIQVTVSRCEDDTCGENQQCKETSFGPSCSCLPGYDGASCTDINECEQATHECSMDETCQNTAGSYRCVPQQEKPPAPKPKKHLAISILIALFASGAIIIALMTICLVYKRTKHTQSS